MTACDSRSEWQSIVIAYGLTIAGAREIARHLLFSSGWGRRISAWLLPSGRVILTRTALYLALAPAGSDSERDRDDALELVLSLLLTRRRRPWFFWFPFL